ncbi:PREDICTED: olfactory receptor 2D2-like [Nanorana parkeri]|uniref:olfactory receptor 2D2-like n=1 Tax=Nanorana parkeri TaxID=125878 RepID=UPI00085421B3|nr:PREDICTED: olfactory receptor 2D2-like [Nanorana parkeri]
MCPEEDGDPLDRCPLMRANLIATHFSVIRQRNQTFITEVLVVGFEDFNEYRIPLFVLLLVIYIATCVENVLIISLVWKSPRLHSPMYFLISNLLLCEFINTTNMDPSALYNILSGTGVISFVGCLAQINVVIAVLIFQTFLLMLMSSYDWYLAICHPLRYSSLMHIRLCLYVIIVFWMIAVLLVSVLIYFLVSLEYCGRVRLDYFFCEYTAYSIAVCVMSDARALITYSWVVSYTLNVTFLLILLSYILIIIAILRIKSSAGRRKAFSTCSSHLLVVSLYFGIPFISYLVPMSMTDYNALSFIYYLVLPMLNPIIYTFRNEDIRQAFRASASELKQYYANKIH